MPRSVRYRRLRVQLRALTKRRDYLTGALHKLVQYGYTDDDLLQKLNECKASIAITELTLSKENT